MKWNKKIEDKIINSKNFKKAANILLYASMQSEVSAYQILKYLWHPNSKKKSILPRVVGQNLALYIVRKMTDLEMSPLGILEPKKNCQKISPEEIELAIVPGVAFTKDGQRLGMGGGFYDRLLPKIKADKIGLAFHCQITNSLPSEEHDVGVETIITN